MTIRRLAAIATASMVALATVSAPAAAHAQPDAPPDSPGESRPGPEPSVEHVEWPPDDWTGWTIYHWDVENDVVSAGLDAAEPSNRDAEAALEAMGVEPSNHQCSLGVSETQLSSGNLTASTSQHCTGVSWHSTAAQFMHSTWYGWSSYSGWGDSRRADSEEHLPVNWSINCGSGGSYEYRLRAHWVVRSGGDLIEGPNRSGDPTAQHHTCGTAP